MRVIFVHGITREYLLDRSLDVVPDQGSVHLQDRVWQVADVTWYIGNNWTYETPDATIYGDHAVVRLM